MMKTKPNLPGEIFWGKDYSWRMDRNVNGWLGLAAVISSLSEIMFPFVVMRWPLGWRVAIVAVEFVAIALWGLALARWIRGMDEMHRQITMTVLLLSLGATFFVMMLWHRLDRAGLFNALFSNPREGGSWDIGTVGHGFLLLILFYGIAQAIFNRRYR